MNANYPTDMTDLDQLLSKRGIPHELRKHPVVVHEPTVKELIGYYPAGEWQIVIDGKYSVIRGMVSWGDYEIFGLDGAPFWNRDPQRFATAEELVKAYEDKTNG